MKLSRSLMSFVSFHCSAATWAYLSILPQRAKGCCDLLSVFQFSHFSCVRRPLISVTVTAQTFISIKVMHWTYFRLLLCRLEQEEQTRQKLQLEKVSSESKIKQLEENLAVQEDTNNKVHSSRVLLYMSVVQFTWLVNYFFSKALHISIGLIIFPRSVNTYKYYSRTS